MTYRLAVDLGTTWTAAATVDDGGEPTVVPLGGARMAMPSVVAVDGDRLVVGEEAQRRLVVDPGSAARECKRRLGDTTPFVLAGTPYGAEALLGHLLAAVVAITSAAHGAPPDEVRLTHPATWGEYKLDLLREAGRVAGCREVVLVAEPVAAAVHYAHVGKVPADGVVAVYDFGGGTFDAAVVRGTAEGFELLGPAEGRDRLGGVDLDQAVLAHVAASVAGALDGLDREDPEVRQSLARLREECVAAKEALSSDTEVTVPVILPGLSTEVRLTRAEFEAAIRPRIDETVAALEQAVAASGVPLEQVDAVLLVGGSSRVPLVAELVAQRTGRPVALDTDTKLAVAAGATVWGVVPMVAAGAVATAAAEASPEAPDDGATGAVAAPPQEAAAGAASARKPGSSADTSDTSDGPAAPARRRRSVARAVKIAAGGAAVAGGVAAAAAGAQALAGDDRGRAAAGDDGLSAVLDAAASGLAGDEPGGGDETGDGGGASLDVFDAVVGRADGPAGGGPASGGSASGGSGAGPAGSGGHGGSVGSVGTGPEARIVTGMGGDESAGGGFRSPVGGSPASLDEVPGASRGTRSGGGDDDAMGSGRAMPPVVDTDQLDAVKDQLRARLEAWHPPADAEPDEVVELKAELSGIIDRFQPAPGQSLDDAVGDIQQRLDDSLEDYAQGEQIERLIEEEQREARERQEELEDKSGYLEYQRALNDYIQAWKPAWPPWIDQAELNAEKGRLLGVVATAAFDPDRDLRAQQQALEGIVKSQLSSFQAEQYRDTYQEQFQNLEQQASGYRAVLTDPNASPEQKQDAADALDQLGRQRDFLNTFYGDIRDAPPESNNEGLEGPLHDHLEPAPLVDLGFRLESQVSLSVLSAIDDGADDGGDALDLTAVAQVGDLTEMATSHGHGVLADVFDELSPAVAAAASVEGFGDTAVAEAPGPPVVAVPVDEHDDVLGLAGAGGPMATGTDPGSAGPVVADPVVADLGVADPADPLSSPDGGEDHGLPPDTAAGAPLDDDDVLGMGAVAVATDHDAPAGLPGDAEAEEDAGDAGDGIPGLADVDGEPVDVGMAVLADPAADDLGADVLLGAGPDDLLPVPEAEELPEDDDLDPTN